MNLDKLLQPEQYPLYLDVASININVRPYTHGDTKAFLELVDDYKRKKKGGMQKLFIAQRNLLDNAILPTATGEKPIQAKDLHRADYVKLLVFLKNITHGEQTPIQFRCSNPKCENEAKQRHIETFPFDFQDCVLQNKERNEIVEYTMQDNTNVKIKMKPYNFSILIDNADIFEAEVPSIEILSKFHASFINEIKINDEEVEDMSTATKIKILTNMVPKYKKSIVEYIDKEPMWKWNRKWECPVCDAKNEATLESISDFFL